MIHHVSIPAHNPEHVASVLAELMGGKCYPFGPLEGAYMAVSGDEHGSMVEVYPDDAVLIYEGEQQAIFEKAEAPRNWPFHMLLSVPLDEAAVTRIGEREGWRTRTFGRGVPGEKPFFHVIEFWVENRLMIEVAPPEMTAEYLELLSRRDLDAMDEDRLRRTRESHLRQHAAAK
jgi:hypothetical protein